MASAIKYTDVMIDDLIKELKNKRDIQGKIKYKHSVEPIFVDFTSNAWAKMWYIVDSFNTEVAWQGVVERDKNTFLITDIFVYPQFVSSSRVEMNTDKYSSWTQTLEDETFKNMRFQGHSHVDMKAFASGEDEKHQQETVDMLKDDDFYIFMIVNKSRDIWIKVFDIKDNTAYYSPPNTFSKQEIIIDVIGNDGIFFSDVYKDAKDLATTSKIQSTNYNKTNTTYEYQTNYTKIDKYIKSDKGLKKYLDDYGVTIYD